MNELPSWTPEPVPIFSSPFVRLFSAIWPESCPFPWKDICLTALERDVLDTVDLSLIRTLGKMAAGGKASGFESAESAAPAPDGPCLEVPDGAAPPAGAGGPAPHVEAEEGDADPDLALLAVMACLCATVKTGSLRLKAGEAALALHLEKWLRLDLDLPENHAVFREKGPEAISRGWARKFLRRAGAGAYARILGRAPEYKPLLLHRGCLYFQKHHAAEACVAGHLAVRLRASAERADAPAARAALEETLRLNPLRRFTAAGPETLSLGPEQEAALAMALRGRFLVISGGPGTGKTTLIAALLRVLARAVPVDPARMRLCAPTGRAAHRLTESLRRNFAGLRAAGAATPADEALSSLACETLHRLLGYHPVTGRFRMGRDNPLEADLVVVDEVSMVDVFLLARLLDALREDARLVLLGDMHQLPSVEAGAVLADLVPQLPLKEAVAKASVRDLHANGRPASQDVPGPDRPQARVAQEPEAARPTRGSGFSPGSSEAMRAWLRTCGLTPPDSPQSLPAAHAVVLERSHRSQAGILEAAACINSQDAAAAIAAMAPAALNPSGAVADWPVPLLGKGADGSLAGCRLLLAPEGDFLGYRDRLLRHWAAYHYQEEGDHGARFGDILRQLARAGNGRSDRDRLLELAFMCLDKARILTLTRKGPFGCEAANRRIRDRLIGMPGGGRGTARGPGGAFPGAPIMILENDYGKGLFNGDVGLVLQLQGRLRAAFRTGEGFLFLPVGFLPRFELAFATTVHKSQGSEYDNVLLLLPERDGRLCYKEAIYTAVTRARIFAGVYGPPEVLEKAVGRRIERESGLREYLEDGSAEIFPSQGGTAGC